MDQQLMENAYIYLFFKEGPKYEFNFKAAVEKTDRFDAVVVVLDFQVVHASSFARK